MTHKFVFEYKTLNKEAIFGQELDQDMLHNIFFEQMAHRIGTDGSADLIVKWDHCRFTEFFEYATHQRSIDDGVEV